MKVLCSACGVSVVDSPGVMCDSCWEAGKMREHDEALKDMMDAAGRDADVVQFAARRDMSAKEAADFLREMADGVERGSIPAVLLVGVAVDEEARPGDVSLARLRYTSSTEDLVKLAGIMSGEALALSLRVAQSLGMVGE